MHMEDAAVGGPYHPPPSGPYHPPPRRRLGRRWCLREALTVTIVLWSMGVWSLVLQTDRRHLQQQQQRPDTPETLPKAPDSLAPRKLRTEQQRRQEREQDRKQPLQQSFKSTTNRTAFTAAKDTGTTGTRTNRSAFTPNDMLLRSGSSINSGSGTTGPIAAGILPHHRESRMRETQLDDPDDWPPIHILEALLNSTLPHNRRLVVAASTLEMVDLCDNFAASLMAVHVTNFVLIPLDTAAHQRLVTAYPRHTLPVPPPHVLPPNKPPVSLLGAAAHFGSVEFQTLTSTRPKLLRPFLEKGYTVWYNDIDMVWRKNAWDVMDSRRRAARQRTRNAPPTDLFVWQDGRGQLCTCLLYLVPTDTTLALLTQWNDEMETRGPGRQQRKGTYDTDQTAFIDIAKRLNWPMGGGSVASSNSTGSRSSSSISVIIFPSDAEFPPGKWYGWNTTNQRQTRTNAKAVIVHNNWIFGKQAKIERFQMAGLWKPSGRLAPAEP